MGVPTMWEILAPAEEKCVKISSLREQTIAVDISIWITGLKSVPVVQDTQTIFFRNLFYRVLKFMSEGIKLVIVVDGKAPALKQATMQNRQRQLGSTSGIVDLERPMLAKLAERCVEMLEGLGLPCVRAEGEGEATCAWLNAHGHVDGCLTNDGDFFCYGGKTVYRNLRKEHGVYVVDRVSDVCIQKELGFCWRDFVSLALLIGCDFNKQGVHSVGKEKAKELIQILKSRKLDVLDRLIGWESNTELDSIETHITNQIKKLSHCKSCDHLGTVSTHEKSGCISCNTETGCEQSGGVVCECDWHKQKQVKDRNTLEIDIRRKSLEKSCFPNQEIIDEFLKDREDHVITFSTIDVARLNQWNISQKAIVELQDHLVPCYIYQQLWFPDLYCNKMFHPIRINRHCTDKHVECYAVSWDKSDLNGWADKAHSTSVVMKIEKTLFERRYPEKVKIYEEALTARKSSKGKKRKAEQRVRPPSTSARKKLFPQIEVVGSSSEDQVPAATSSTEEPAATNSNSAGEPAATQEPISKNKHSATFSKSSSGVFEESKRNNTSVKSTKKKSKAESNFTQGTLLHWFK